MVNNLKIVAAESLVALGVLIDSAHILVGSTRPNYAIAELQKANAYNKEFIRCGTTFPGGKKTDLFDLTMYEYICKADRLDFITDLMPDDIEKYIHSSTRVNGRRIKDKSKQTKQREKIIQDIEDASNCELSNSH